MRTLYVEGGATHDGPESCVVVCEDGGEALTGVRAGWAIEPRHHGVRGADAVELCGRQHCQWRYREPLRDPARSKNLCMHGVSMRENREIPRPPDRLIAGRAARARPRP